MNHFLIKNIDQVQILFLYDLFVADFELLDIKNRLNSKQRIKKKKKLFKDQKAI